MKIWELNSDEKSCALTSDDNKPGMENHPMFSGFNGTPKFNEWTPFHVIRYRKGKYCDFPSFASGTAVFPQPTFEKIGSALQGQVEYLPLSNEEMDFWLVNVTNVINCTNKEKSTPETLRTGEVLWLKKVVFYSEQIPEGTLIFKIPENRHSIYVTDQFIELVKKHKLKGFKFTEEWDSEFTEEMEQAKQRKYQETLDSIERNKGAEFSYEEAIKKVGSGLAVASDKWKMQQDKKGRFWLGQLGEDAEYHWLMPVYIPPVLLGYLWHEVERTELQNGGKI